ncbi:MAG: alpha/beta hydrolase [Alphaproteobacteria bacterium]|nr:alpha/beta hydrolase [Alphaproteobacteria bacterium]
MKVVIIHGTYGSPEGNWFPWLKGKLEELGHEVYVPSFPTPENQSPENWCNVLIKEVPFIFDDDTVLIGHSLGANYLLHILDMERKVKIKKAIFVSVFNSELGNEEYDNLNRPFIKDFNWENIKNNTNEITIYHSDDDPFIPLSEAEGIYSKLGGKFKLIKNGGHLNKAAGFTKFDELLKEVLI